jgi:hypothetical protein
MQKFWMVWVEGTRGPTYQHLGSNEAVIEAERLARMPENTNKRVYILEARAYCAVTNIKWEHFD